MHELINPYEQAAPLSVEHRSRLEVAIAGWLDEKFGLSNSHPTRDRYAATLGRFRETLRAAGHDLDGNPEIIGLAAQGFASQHARGGVPAPATRNVRLASLSSFYEYAIRRKLLPGPNPIDTIRRSKVQAYGSAVAMPAQAVIDRLRMIDRTTLLGKRDYALLSLGVTTGRRLAELQSLTIGDLTVVERSVVVVTWRRVKGGKTMRDQLAARVARALLDYLDASQVARAGHPALQGANAPLWVNLGRGCEGQALGRKGIARLCERELGTTKTHTLRHTFAALLEKQHATITQIQRKLGHTNPATTGLYLMNLTVEADPLADEIADLLSI